MKKHIIAKIAVAVSAVLLLPLSVFADSTEKTAATVPTAGKNLWIALGILVLVVLLYMVWNIIRTRKEEKKKEKLIKPHLVIIQHGKKQRG